METALAEPVADKQQLAARVSRTPMDMIHLAIERGINPDQLGKLVDLAERFQQKEAERLFNESMAAAQAEMPTVVRDAENAHTKKLYARLETIAQQCKPVWLRHGFSLSFSQAEPVQPGMIRVVCTIAHKGGHSRQAWIEMPPDGTGAKGGASGMNALQGVGSTWSYADRYLTCKVFGITVADQDNDGCGAFISGPQVARLNELLEARAKAKGLDPAESLAAFLQFCGIESLDKMPLAFYGKAEQTLLAKARKQ